MSIISTSWDILCQLSPWMLLGMLLSGLLHVLLPRDFIRRRLQGFRGVLSAVAIGVPLPLCSCGVVPAGIGLKNDGASDGASVGFLISTPQTGVDSILVSAAFFGWPFAIFKMVAAAITGIVGGVIADTGHRETETFATDNDCSTQKTQAAGSVSDGDSSEARGMVGMARDAWNHGVEVVRSIWLWLLIGVAISAVIQELVPPSVFESISGFGLLLSMLLVLVISVPLYVCATASVPIAAGLVASGLPPSVALVFLMAGPATNVTTIAAVYGRFGRRTLTVYLVTIIFGSMLFAWIFDWVINPQLAADAVAHVHDHGGWVSTASAIALSLLIASFIWQDAAKYLKSKNRVASDNETQINISGMHCGSCVSRVENALKQIDGIETVDVTLKPGVATITGEFEPSSVEQAVTDLGFQVEQ